MNERRKNLLSIPFFKTFQLALVVITAGFLLSVFILYYSFTKKSEKSHSVKNKTIKVNKFLELHHSQFSKMIDDEPLNLDKETIYYSIVSKIFSFGNNFKAKCYETANNANDIYFSEKVFKKDANLNLGIFKVTNLLVVSSTTHIFDIPLKEGDRKVYHQLIGINNFKQPYVIHYLETPNFKIEKLRSSINFCGVFYRVIKYENIDGKEVRAPLFLTYSIEKFILPRTYRSPLITIIIMLVIAGIFILYFLRHKAKMKQLEIEIRDKKRNR